MTSREKDIQKICSSWRNGFIGSDKAMHEINQLMQYTKVSGTNAFIYASEGDVISRVDKIDMLIRKVDDGK